MNWDRWIERYREGRAFATNGPLVSFKVDHERAARMASQIPDGVVKVAESGVRGPEDARSLVAAGSGWSPAEAYDVYAFAAMGLEDAPSYGEMVRSMGHLDRTFYPYYKADVEAGRLEARFSKAEILAFYLNQVPYARQRRGVAVVRVTMWLLRTVRLS